jgi:hypothetical protein
MAANHAAAIFHWRDHVDKQPPGLQGAPSATIATMLFGCHHWLEHHSATSPAETRQRIEQIRAELESWQAERVQS